MYVNINCDKNDSNTYASIKVNAEFIEKCRNAKHIIETSSFITEIRLEARIEWIEGSIFDEETSHPIDFRGEVVSHEDIDQGEYGDMPASLTRSESEEPRAAISGSRLAVDKKGFVYAVGQDRSDGETFETDTVPVEVFLRVIDILNECDPKLDLGLG